VLLPEPFIHLLESLCSGGWSIFLKELRCWVPRKCTTVPSSMAPVSFLCAMLRVTCLGHVSTTSGK